MTDNLLAITVIIVALAIVALLFENRHLRRDLEFERSHHEVLIRNSDDVVCPEPLIGGRPYDQHATRTDEDESAP